MEKVREIIRSKPRIYLYIAIGYLLVVALLRWVLHPSLDALWFVIGGILGVYFLDAAETFFALSPSPFRSVVFFSLFAAVTFFAVTSSTSIIGGGLVLSLYLQMLLWQVGELRVMGNLNSWYRMVAGPVNTATQRTVFVGFVIFFFIATYFFIR